MSCPIGTWVLMGSTVNTKLPRQIAQANPSRFMPLRALSMLSAWMK